MTNSNHKIEILYTAQGAEVAAVEVLPFTTPPDVIVWGTRTFALMADGQYFECFAYHALTTGEEAMRLLEEARKETQS